MLVVRCESGAGCSVMTPEADGLPRMKQMSAGRKPESYFLFGGIERLTYDILRGEAVSAATVRDAQAIIQRVHALEDALNNRISAQYHDATGE